MPATHGMHGTREYKSWATLKARCYDPKHHRYYLYGARGIKVCERWRNDFQAFYDDMGPKPSPEHTIDRIDPDGDYEPGNCRWASRDEQRNNRRNTRYVVYRGERMPLFYAVKKAGNVVTRNTAQCRIYTGWPVEEALETPPLPSPIGKRK